MTDSQTDIIRELSEASERTALQRALTRAKYEFVNLLAPFPVLYMPLARRGPAVQRLRRAALVDESTEMTVEAFPGSGNTHAVGLFGKDGTHIAHHAHAAAQVIESVRRGLPTLVIVRDPEEAVLSFVVRHKVVTLRQALRQYVRFHRSIYAWRQGFMVCTFEDLIGDPDHVLSAFDSRFDTDYLRRGAPTMTEIAAAVREWHSNGRVEEVYESDVPLPSDVRDRLKDALRPHIRSRPVLPLLERAISVYRTFCTLAE